MLLTAARQQVCCLSCSGCKAYRRLASSTLKRTPCPLCACCRQNPAGVAVAVQRIARVLFVASRPVDAALLVRAKAGAL